MKQEFRNLLLKPYARFFTCRKTGLHLDWSEVELYVAAQDHITPVVVDFISDDDPQKRLGLVHEPSMLLDDKIGFKNGESASRPELLLGYCSDREPLRQERSYLLHFSKVESHGLGK